MTRREAFRRAGEYAKTRFAVSENSARFPDRPVNATDTRREKAPTSLGNLVAVQGFEPRETAMNEDSSGDSASMISSCPGRTREPGEPQT